MRESRWRSMSIMDLNLTKRRSLGQSGGSSGGVMASAMSLSNNSGQSYELIKSTQSLVDRLRLNAEDITIQPVHPSIIGQDTWFQITYTSSGTTRYFSCQNAKERDEWIQSLKKTLMLTEDRRRTDNCLKLVVLEVKGLRDNKKYYVEIHVDDKLYARTSSKKMDGMCFWGEHFEFKDLPHTDKISLHIHKDKGNRKKPKKPVGRVKISIASIQSRYAQEKWHPVDKSSRRESPSIRLKCQFQSVDILPLRDYEDFLYFLKDEYKSICKLFEPNISVKVKEELSLSLMNVFHGEDIAEDVLAEIVVDEISNIENEHLTFRGNSIATKAMESYIKLVGQRYLQSTLQNVITERLLNDQDLEVDPIKVSDPDELRTNRANLQKAVKQVWSRIAKSYSYFPIQLQRCFYKIRQYLQHVGKPEVGDNLISSCIFLRYLCPAILSPSLFNLTDEYPSKRANRNLTLIAKTLQTLANFTRYEGKENSMEFLNSFLDEESGPMKSFLHQISSPLAEDGWIPNLASPLEKTDLGKHLSCLHCILFENIGKMPSDNAKALRLRELLDDINNILHRPTINQLQQISQPTLTSLRQAQGEHTPIGNPQQKSTFTWSWTLPKRPKANGNNDRNSTTFSHPIPQHSGSNKSSASIIFAKPEAGISLSSDTSSSTSLTPSPGAQMKGRMWSTKSSASSSSSSAILGPHRHKHATDLPLRRAKMSTMSLDDTDSSDDSTYSSQCQSDATSTPKCTSHTLPRPVTGGVGGYSTHGRHKGVHRGGISRTQLNAKSFSDYEHEIMELRNAMETLQIKLIETERKLEHQEYSTCSSPVQREENSVREMVNRLVNEEDQLRRDHVDMDGDRGEKERMILMQQKKIAALDTANERLVQELNRLGEKLKGGLVMADCDGTNSTITSTTATSSNLTTSDRRLSEPRPKARETFTSNTLPSRRTTNNMVQDTPKTVEELLDSLHSTPI
ncbi:hypothetical protein TCAL_13221 [Tigriopus californicus]|uniref:Ras-GAP domain-containing protein n=1 Tax=Tigriopus californicus TaxID=6832 RepID=A0A553PKJ2_TIGCA|nr:ras GTPase-activating protein raskol-like [Tigriopus californicus]TRY78202.1 hypothetical protein TCAL_13221 [Tigriopus californicus]